MKNIIHLNILIKKWYDTTKKEIYTFLLIYDYLGILKLSSIKMNSSSNIYLKQPWITERITFDRYNQINKSIRFSSNSFSSKKKEDKYEDFLRSIINNSNLYYISSTSKVLMNQRLNFQKELNISYI